MSFLQPATKKKIATACKDHAGPPLRHNVPRSSFRGIKVVAMPRVEDRSIRTLRWVALFIAFVLGACGGHASPVVPSEGNDTPPPPLVEATSTPLTAASDPPIEPQPASPAAKKLDAFPVFTDPGDLPALVVADAKGTKLPLKETRVTARLSQFVADVEVRQRYENDALDPIEAIYTFPLPENAAVHHMTMVIGDRTIEAKIEERGQAKKLYDRAKKDGKTAALLEQERPNVFTQSVANIVPGKPIEVVVRYVQELSYDAGVHEFVFPMVVGPRFGGAKDLARVTPPYAGKGERTGRDISIEIITDPALAVSEVEAITHAVDKRKDDDGLVHITLSPRDKVPNRDFVLRYRVATEKPSGTMLVSAATGGHFSVVIDPPELDVDDLVGQRELVFVVDVSGSMKGVPLALCKRAMRLALGKIRPFDTFNVLSFAGSTQKLFPDAQPANDDNVRRALDFVDSMAAGGGTMMVDAVADALAPGEATGRDRYVFFLTDGFVSVDEQIMSSTRTFVKAMSDKGRRAKVFGFGVGSSPNRSLIDGMSREGKGVAVYATNREDPDRAVNQFFRYVDRSVLRDVSIDWGGAKVSEVTPQEMPDLFASHPLIVHGRIDGAPSRPPILHATTASGPIQIPLKVFQPPKDRPREELGMLWARSKIAWLETDLAAGDAAARSEITRLGLDFHIVTRFTSFIAIDKASSTAAGAPRQVIQTSDAPEDVDMDAAGAKKPEVTSSGPAAGAAPPADSDEERRVYADAPPSAEYRRACGCRTVGAPTPWRGPTALFVIAVLVAAQRRRRRSART